MFPSQEDIEKHSIPFYSDGVGTLRFKWENVGYDKLTPASMKMAVEGKLVTIPFQYGTLTENFLLDDKAKLWRIFCLQKYVPEIHKHFNI